MRFMDIRLSHLLDSKLYGTVHKHLKTLKYFSYKAQIP